MPSIALVAAGDRLGLALGRTFGAHGYRVALIARSREHLDRLAGTLASAGVDAAGFPADVTDRPALTTALHEAAARFGALDVLQYSAPYLATGEPGMTGVLDVTAENLQPQLDATCHGAITATRAVLPAMRMAGAGTVLFTTGASAVQPTAWAGTAGAAGAALRNWALNLHAATARDGVHVGYVAVGAWIAGTPGTPADAEPVPAERVARVHWDLHVARDRAETLVRP